MHNTIKSINSTRLINGITVTQVIITFLTLLGLVLIGMSLGKLGTITSCDESNCASTDCYMSSCIDGVCVSTKRDGCFEIGVTNQNDYYSFNNDYNYHFSINSNNNNTSNNNTAYKMASLFTGNVTSGNHMNGFNHTMYIEEVGFENSTIMFDCMYGNDTECDINYKKLFFASRLYVREFLASNGFHITLNNNTIIFSNGTTDLYNATVTFAKLVVLNQMCIDDMVDCINSTGITIKNITFSDRGMSVPSLNISGNVITENVILELNRTFNLSLFTINNGIIQAYDDPLYIDAFFNPNEGNIGINYNSTDYVTYDTDVNGTTRCDGIYFGHENNTNDDFLLSSFKYDQITPHFYGPWKQNYTSTLVFNKIGHTVFVKIKNAITQTAYKNSTILSSLKIPESYRPNVDNFNNIVATIVAYSQNPSNPTLNYIANPGVIRITNDGTMVIYNTQVNLESSATTTFLSNEIPFLKNYISGFLPCTFSYNIM